MCVCCFERRNERAMAVGSAVKRPSHPVCVYVSVFVCVCPLTILKVHTQQQQIQCLAHKELECKYLYVCLTKLKGEIYLQRICWPENVYMT